MVPEAFQFTPNAEQYVLQADALRRRQLRAALLYGSSRYWRRRQRVWPAVIGGVILVAIICGGISVASAFHKQQEINKERESARNPGSVSQQQNPAGQSGAGGK
ncbi:hypothetical protein GCM10009799_22550 [Nocardiopsis rhodophaea]|uniref:Uncharacterized protein n=1 Tax=Nocardiopsis rhodophaea TaxID=280238 RepID=A0ABN2SZW6_9ACTN